MSTLTSTPPTSASAATAVGRSTTKSSLLDRVLALRPAYRWGLLLVVAIAAYAFASDYPWAWAQDLNVESSRLANIIDESVARNATVNGDAKIQEEAKTFGRIRIPREERDGTQALSKSIERVFRETNAKFKSNVRYTLDVRSASKFPAGTLHEVVAKNERIERISGDLKFDAPPDLAATVVQQLESSDDIESVGRLKFGKVSGSEKKLSVQLTVEAWVRVPERNK